MSADVWNIIAAVSAAVQSVVIIVALLFAVAQIREAERARSTEALRQVFETLSSPGSRRDRRLVYQSAGMSFDEMPDEQLERLWSVAIAFNNVGLLITRGYLPAEVVFDIYGDAAVRCWSVLKPLVEQERKRRGELDSTPYYLKYFEQLARNSERYLEKQYPGYHRLTYGNLSLKAVE